MRNFDFDVVIPSHRPELAEEARLSMSPIQPIMFINSGYPSFSKLINDCILRARKEIVIICNDKARPSALDEFRTVELLGQGFGFVGMHNFRHFGFHKDLIRRIGFFDERYEGGEFEDFDFLRRIQESDIAVYMSKEIPCVELACSWNSQKTYAFNHLKWKECGTHTVRVLDDEPRKYDLGSSKGTVWKPYKESVLKNEHTPKEFLV